MRMHICNRYLAISPSLVKFVHSFFFAGHGKCASSEQIICGASAMSSRYFAEEVMESLRLGVETEI